MFYERSSLRYAHTNGHTGLVYTDDGQYIVTCGSDGDIRRWKCIDDDDPVSNCLGEFVMTIAYIDGRLFASTDRNTIQAYTFPAMDADGILMRFTAPATCLAVHGNYVAAGSEDTKIKVLKGEGSMEMQLDGHTGPLLAIDMCSSKDLLASVAGDGQLKIWNLQSGSEIKSISGLDKVNCFESATCFGTPNFEPTKGDTLAYAQDNKICVLNTNNWELQFTLTDERVSANYSCCQFSRDGQLLAAGTTSGELSVFDYKQRRPIKVQATPSDCGAITSLAWSGKNNDELAFCDATGQLGTIYTSSEQTEDQEDEKKSFLTNGFGDIEFENDTDSIKASGDMSNGICGDGDDDENGVSLEKLKKKVMDNAVSNFHDDDNSAFHDLDENTKNSVSSIVSDKVEKTVKTYKQQNAFQPGATPLDLEHRYLVWNDVGIVTSHADLSADGSIDVEFHDASVHHSLHIPNYSQHNMASLSDTVLALSSTDSTKLVCIALATSGNKEWSLEMPDCESIEALTATSKLVAVATGMHFLRLFTVMGTQREVLSIPGPVVALAGHDYSILVIYHRATSSVNQQNLGALLVQCTGLSLRVQQLTLPLTPRRQLTWVGFTDCGSPTFADSMGLIQLYRLQSNAWFPICDTMKQSSSISNNYFIISISERSQIVQAVLCRGTSYPMTNPRPMLQELRMQLPICDADSEKSELEDTLLRAAIMNVDNRDKTMKETAVKLFALACRSELEIRAKELIETISCPELLQLAVKYASKLGRIHLSDRLSELMPQIETEREARMQQQSLLNSNIAAPIVYLPMTPKLNSHPVASPNLAPKSIEISVAKRAPLKRFSLANSPNIFKAKIASNAGPTLETLDNESQFDTQENMLENDPPSNSPYIATLESKVAEPLTSSNSVNPFAMKRKITDTGVIFGSEKLKLAKK